MMPNVREEGFEDDRKRLFKVSLATFWDWKNLLPETRNSYSGDLMAFETSQSVMQGHLMSL